MKVLVTGAAGFIGYHLSKRLLGEGHEVVGLDNLNDYYSVELKEERLSHLHDLAGFTFERVDLADKPEVERVFKAGEFTHVMHLAAQAGVRYSLINPGAYIDANVNGFFHVMDMCRLTKVQHFVYASSSSVYGLNSKMSFSVHDNVDHPISLYAATKKSNELLAHSYSHLFKLPTTGLRFFTVYGPWGRPDMALFLFTKAILDGEPIKIFNHGKMRRDFTYIDDIIEGVVRVLQNIPQGNPDWSGDTPDPSSSPGPYKIYNIGNNNTVELMDFVSAIEDSLGMEAKKEYLPLQPGDVPASFADVDDLIRDIGFKPDTPIKTGIKNFVDWYRRYYSV